MRRKVRLYAYTMVDRYTMLSGSQAGCRTDNRSMICGVSGTQTSSISKRQVQGVNAAIYFLRIHGVEQVEEMAEKVKVKEADLYSAFIEVLYTQGAQVRITQCYLQITPYLPVPRKHSPDGASRTEVADI